PRARCATRRRARCAACGRWWAAPSPSTCSAWCCRAWASSSSCSGGPTGARARTASATASACGAAPTPCSSAWRTWPRSLPPSRTTPRACWPCSAAAACC
ncbi:hypothetical protein EV174_005954, partial [Coemansia sp. RSA 2320]